MVLLEMLIMSVQYYTDMAGFTPRYGVQDV